MILCVFQMAFNTEACTDKCSNGVFAIDDVRIWQDSCSNVKEVQPESKWANQLDNSFFIMTHFDVAGYNIFCCAETQDMLRLYSLCGRHHFVHTVVASILCSLTLCVAIYLINCRKGRRYFIFTVMRRKDNHRQLKLRSSCYVLRTTESAPGERK